MRDGVKIEGIQDLNFIFTLFGKIQGRDKRRIRQKEVFSPSALGSCLRHVYLRRHHVELDIPFRRPFKPDANFYFLNGNFLHVKWQYVMHKMEQKINDPAIFKVHGFEVPVLSKWKDHGGTIDAIVEIHGEPYLIDMKGLNVRSTMQVLHGDAPISYVIQLTDYMVLWNAQRKPHLS
jgi:hypothetical protein